MTESFIKHSFNVDILSSFVLPLHTATMIVPVSVIYTVPILVDPRHHPYTHTTLRHIILPDESFSICWCRWIRL